MKSPSLSPKVLLQGHAVLKTERKVWNCPPLGEGASASLLPTPHPGLVLPGQGRCSLAQAQRRTTGDSRNVGWKRLRHRLTRGSLPSVPQPHTILRVHLSAPPETNGLGRLPEKLSHIYPPPNCLANQQLFTGLFSLPDYQVWHNW